MGRNSGKNIKKSLAQEVRQKSDISEHRRVEGMFVPFNPYFVCNTAIGSLCDMYGVPLELVELACIQVTKYYSSENVTNLFPSCS